MGSTRQSSIQQGRCHTETCSVRVNLDFPLWHPSWNQSKIRSQKCGKKYSKINTQNLNIQIQKCPLRTKHNGSFPGQNIPDDALEKISSSKNLQLCNGLYDVKAKLHCLQKSSLEAGKNVILSVLIMLVMPSLFHLSRGDGQCSWKLNIIKAFQGLLPKKLETSRTKGSNAMVKKKFLVPTTCLIGWKIFSYWR